MTEKSEVLTDVFWTDTPYTHEQFPNRTFWYIGVSYCSPNSIVFESKIDPGLMELGDQQYVTYEFEKATRVFRKAKIKKKGWTNIYKATANTSRVNRSPVYKSEREAIGSSGVDCIATVPIEWEE